MTSEVVPAIVPLVEALKQITSSIDEEAQRACIFILVKITENLINHPQELKFRKIKKSTPAMMHKVCSISGGTEAMSELGWMDGSIDGEDCWVLSDEAAKCQGPALQTLTSLLGKLCPSVVIIGISGVSGCGKSTLAEAIASKFDSPLRPINMDSYFVPSLMPIDPRWGKLWETPNSIDFAACCNDLRKLVGIMTRGAIVPSKFCLGTSNPFCIGGASVVRDEFAGKQLHANATVVIVVEGFLAFYDASISAMFDARIWLDADFETCIKRRYNREGNNISPECFKEWFGAVVWSNYQKYKDAQLLNVPDALRMEAREKLYFLIQTFSEYCKTRLPNSDLSVLSRFPTGDHLAPAMAAATPTAVAATQIALAAAASAPHERKKRKYNVPSDSINITLTQLCAAVKKAGEQPESVLLFVQKLFGNIKSNPRENKYRSLRLDNAKLHQNMWRFHGAKEFLLAAGFEESCGALVLPDRSAVKFNDAFRAILRWCAAESQDNIHSGLASEANAAIASPADIALTGTRESEAPSGIDAFELQRYKAALKGSVMGAGRAEVYRLVNQTTGLEAMHLLDKALQNLITFPNKDDYRLLNMSGKSGKKLLPALSLLRLAGFELWTHEDGRDMAGISSMNVHKLARIIAMVRLALSPEAAAISLPKCVGIQSCSLGAALGVAVGDAMGAALEKPRTTPKSAAEVDKALEMSGDTWVAPGQVTDDTEMTVALADALACCVGIAFPIDRVSGNYCEWALSGPFDIGFTTERAFCSLDSSAADCKKRALPSIESQANGALMRCSPLAVWAVGRDMSMKQLGACARAEASLSHPNPVLGHANASYVIALATLLSNNGDREVAIRGARLYLEEQKQLDSEGAAEAHGWLELALDDATDVPYAGSRGGGWAKIAFTHAFRHLKLGTSFEEAMRITLTAGGDTDTNAAIVGGLLGAAVGIHGIPDHALRAVLSCDTSKGCHKRPAKYHPNRLPDLIKKLLDGLAE